MQWVQHASNLPSVGIGNGPFRDPVETRCRGDGSPAASPPCASCCISICACAKG